MHTIESSNENLALPLGTAGPARVLLMALEDDPSVQVLDHAPAEDLPRVSGLLLALVFDELQVLSPLGDFLAAQI